MLTWFTDERIPVRPLFLGKTSTFLQLLCVLAALAQFNAIEPTDFMVLMYVTVAASGISGLQYMYRGLVLLGASPPGTRVVLVERQVFSRPEAEAAACVLAKVERRDLGLRFGDPLRDESADQQPHRFDRLNPDQRKVAEHEGRIAQRREAVGLLLVPGDLRRHPAAPDII